MHVVTGPVCASTTIFSEEPEEDEHKYFLKCEPCDVKWKSPEVSDKCWSCGEIRFQWH